MADILPINFPLPPEQSIASFEWKDLATGEGLEKYYLTRELFAYGSDDEFLLGFETPGNAFSKSISVNDTVETWDSTPFKLPRYTSGTAYLFARTGGTSSGKYYFFQIQIWDGTSARDLTADTRTANTVGATDETFLKMPITNPTTIKKGEQIRIKITYKIPSGSAYLRGSEGDPSYVAIPFRPDN